MFTVLQTQLTNLAVALHLLSVVLAAPAIYEILPQSPQSDGFSGGVGNVSSSPKTPPNSVLGGNKDGITEENVFSVLDSLIRCESSGRRGAINPKDIDGRPKYGELQYDLRTWAMWEKEFNFKGNPMNRRDATHLTRLALLAGYGYHWGCFNKVKP